MKFATAGGKTGDRSEPKPRIHSLCESIRYEIPKDQIFPMTKMSDVLRRADRTAAFALLLVFATVSGAATRGNIPTTNHQYTNNPSTVQLRGIAAESATRVAALSHEPLMSADAVQAAPSAVYLSSRIELYPTSTPSLSVGERRREPGRPSSGRGPSGFWEKR